MWQEENKPKKVELFSFQTANLSWRLWQKGWLKYTLLLSFSAFVCTYLILLSTSAAVSSRVKCLQAFTANLQTGNQKLKTSNWMTPLLTFFLLLSLLRSLLFFFLQIKLPSSFSVSAPCRPRVLIHSAPGDACVLFIKQKNQPGSAVCLPLQVSAVRCTFFSSFHSLWKIYTLTGHFMVYTCLTAR